MCSTAFPRSPMRRACAAALASFLARHDGRLSVGELVELLIDQARPQGRAWFRAAVEQAVDDLARSGMATLIPEQGGRDILVRLTVHDVTGTRVEEVRR